MSIGLENSEHRRGKTFFGWWIVLAGGLLSLWASSKFNNSSIFFGSVSHTLDLDTTKLSSAATFATLIAAIIAPLVGWLSDRRGPKIMIITGVFLTGSGLILMNWMNSLWSLYLVWAGIVSTGIYLCSGLPVDVAIVNWFIKKRGVALFLYGMVAVLSAGIGRLSVDLLIQKIDWRLTCIVVGLSVWIIGLPLARFCMKARRPEHYGLMPDGAPSYVKEPEDVIEAASEYAIEAGDIEMTAGQALTTRAFWLLILASMFSTVLHPAFTIHLLPFLTDTGMAHTMAGKTIRISILAFFLVSIMTAFVVDKISTSGIRFLPACAFFIQCVSIILLLLNQQSRILLYSSMILLGAGKGMIGLPVIIMRARYFSRKNFGLITGLSRTILLPAAMMSPLAVGWVFDITQSYRLIFLLCAVSTGLAGVIMVYAAPPKVENNADSNTSVPA